MIIPDKLKDLFQLGGEAGRDPRLYINAEPRAYAVVKTTDAWLFTEPNPASERRNQLLFGEALNVYDEKNGFYHVQSRHDQYIGWVHGSLLQQVEAPPRDLAYRTIANAAVTAAPDFKSPLITYLAPDSRFAAEAEEGNYLKLAGRGWVHRAQIAPRSKTFDIVETARQYIGRSYIWGGRAAVGLDCSALAQLVYRLAGREIPRDTDLQRKYLSQHHKTVRAVELEPGDLIFVPGHVMIAADKQHVIHANAYHMRVVEEPTREAITRMQAQSSGNFGITACRWVG